MTVRRTARRTARRRGISSRNDSGRRARAWASGGAGGAGGGGGDDGTADGAAGGGAKRDFSEKRFRQAVECMGRRFAARLIVQPPRRRMPQGGGSEWNATHLRGTTH